MKIEEKQNISYDDWAFSPVPSGNKHPLYRTVAEWVGFSFAPVAIATAVTLGHQFTFWTFLLIVVVGSFFLAFASACSGYVAQQTGLTFGLMTRYIFGNVGYKVPCAIVPISLVGWNSFNLSLMASFTSNFFDVGAVYPYLCFGYMILFVTPAIMGFSWISRISTIIVPAMILFLGYGVILASEDIKSLPELWPATMSNSINLATGFTSVVGLFALGTSVSSPDIQRFCPTARDSTLTATITFGIAFPFLLFSGAICGLVGNDTSINAAFSTMGAPLLGFILLALLTWTTADNDYYSASLGFASLTGFPRPAMVLCAAIPAASIAAANLQDHLLQWLVIMSTISTPISGLIVADYVWGRKHWKTDTNNVGNKESLQRIRYESYASWAIGVITVYMSNKFGFLIPPLNGMVISFCCHGFLMKTKKS